VNESEPVSTTEKVVEKETNQASIEIKDSENESNATPVLVEKEIVAEQATAANIEDPGDIICKDVTVIEEITDEVCHDDEYI
jgi:hypothetical protein